MICQNFAKAFDKVDRNILLTKLHNAGTRGIIMNRLKRFLQHTTQSVLVNGENSAPVEGLCGVPQGTALSPLLYLIMNYDLS